MVTRSCPFVHTVPFALNTIVISLPEVLAATVKGEIVAAPSPAASAAPIIPINIKIVITMVFNTARARPNIYNNILIMNFLICALLPVNCNKLANKKLPVIAVFLSDLINGNATK